ncbi:cytochrome P450 [Nocardioides sp. Bht2]|uniref:cytochrome P450 n=1 Tax=Nocardioides sp. Bht2 TaxID=3392297 RepID=UPI0039B4306D
MALRYDPFDPKFRTDPYPAYAELRTETPVAHHPAGAGQPEFWALTRFADVWDAVRDPATFSSAQGLTFFPDEIGSLGIPPTLVMLDPPVQTRLRGLIGRAFTPRRIAELEQRIRAFVKERIGELTERAAGGETPDLHQLFSAPIPVFVLADLLGVPESERASFTPWVAGLTAIQNDGFAIDVDQVSGQHAVGEMLGYFSEAITHRRSCTAHDDLISALVTTELDGAQLSDWDILGFCFVMVAGGSDTTASLISHAITLLTEAPAQREILLAEPTLIPSSVLEFLRLESSVQALARTTTRDVTLHDQTIPAGQKVMMVYGSANRDEAEFGRNADQLDVLRRPDRHLAFSSGPHFCIGSHAARLQATIALEELLAAHPRITAEAAAGERHDSYFVRAWKSLPCGDLSR